MSYLIRDSVPVELTGAVRYLLNNSIPYMQLGSREYALQMCCYQSRVEAEQMASKLTRSFRREFVVEEV